MNKIVVSALYHFVRIKQPSNLHEPLTEFLESNDIRGTLILAEEGINGTVSGSRESIDALYQWFSLHPLFEGVKSKESFHKEQPFYRTKVKIKKEIVTMGIEGIDPKQIVGTYIKPDQWNELVSDPEVLLIDTRNNYEFQIGSFKGAVNPNTESFREFPAYVSENLNPEKHKKVAMFCTGGIRCEKSTAFLKEKGFEEVFHLEGGILKYLEDIPAEESIWQGDCFVFDHRVSVGHGLVAGEFKLCHACRKPLSVTEQKHEHFQEGVSCHHCYATISDSQRQRYVERQRQLVLSKSRGEHHLGKDSYITNETRKLKKQVSRNKQRELSLKKNGALI